MKKLILLFTICLWCMVNANAQTENPKVTEKDYLNVMNQVLPDDTGTYLLENCAGFKMDSDIMNFFSAMTTPGRTHGVFDTIFSMADSSFILSQINQSDGYTWKTGQLKSVTLIDHKTIDSLFKSHFRGWEAFGTKYNRAGFFRISVPIFSKDLNTCVFFEDWLCGDLCGQGTVYYYRKLEGKWGIIYSFIVWMS